MDTHETLRRLLAGARLTEPEAEAVFEQMLTGALSDAQIASLLTLIQVRGATVDELVGAARVMRRHVAPIPVNDSGACVIDTCGTGGAPKTFNVSTAAAIVAAAAAPGAPHSPVRVLVAKHGNRSRTGRGSAEVLSALGVNVDAPPDVQARCLEQAGVCFCFAIHHHPATRHATPARRALGFPTIFNLLGPLTNPARADRQVIGIYARDLVEPMAHALARLGARRAMVVHGSDGMDEVTTTGPSFCALVRDGAVTTETYDPASIGVPRASPSDLVASDLDDAARIITDVLAGSHGPHRDIVALNAAAGLVIAGAAQDSREGFAMASDAIDSGAARRTLASLAALSHSK